MAALLALAPAQANSMSGGYQLFERVTSGVSADNTLTALENFDYFAKTASECCNATDNTGDTTTLYRGVGADEYRDIMGTGGFRPNPNGGSFETGKQFGYDLDEVLEFSNFATDISGVVKIEVPTSTLNNIGDLTHVDSFIFRSGTVTIPTNKLDEFNSCISGLCDALD